MVPIRTEPGHAEFNTDFAHVDLRLVRDYSPTAALVHAIVLSNDQGGGAEIGYQAIAETTGISLSTAQRAIKTLQEGGFLKPESQGGRLTNRYQSPTVRDGSPVPPEASDVQSDRPGVFPIGTEDRKEVVHIDDENQLDTVSVSSSSTSNLKKYSVPKGCEYPWRRRQYGRRLNIVSPEIYDVVQLFEDYIHPGSKKVITAKRRNSWHATAVKMVFERKRTLQEITAVITMVFEDDFGQLPDKPKYGSERKVTRLAQIDENWDMLMDCLLGEFMKPGTVSGEVNTRIKTKYFKPLNDSSMEQQALTLAKKFNTFRDPTGLLAKNPARTKNLEFRREGWKKTFRIMLANDGYSFDDIALVIE